MKEKIKEIIMLINQWKIIIIIFLIGAALFYWYQVRLQMSYSYCNERAIEQAQELYKENIEKQYYITENEKDKIEKGYYLVPNYESYYKRCLREKGINR